MKLKRKKIEARDLGGECGICGENFGTKWVGHWYVCGERECVERAMEHMKDWHEEMSGLIVATR